MPAPSSPARTLVTSALPYANGPIHFGHIAGAYLPADIYVRYKRLTGAEVLFICGTDEHGAPILVNAEKEGLDPARYTDRWHEAIKGSFQRLDIAFDHFSRTSRPIHHETTVRFFEQLHQNGFITTQVADQLYCDTCQRGLPDRYVTGTCPNPECRFPNARGDECPKCGGAFDAIDLGDPVCKTCGRPASRRPAKHWYLDLPALRARLDAYHAERFPGWRQNVVGEVQRYMRELRPRPITRDLSWGIRVPLPEAADKVFYVWFDAPIGYVSATREWARERGLPEDAWRTWWQAEDTRIVHFIGKDNIAFHAVIFPAMLLGQSERYALPDVPANEFLNLEGGKFSTSGGWYIAIDDFTARYPADTLRWTLARSAPETRDSEFTWKDFQTRVNTELLNVFGNFASRVLKFVESKYAGAIPAAAAPLGPEEQLALAALEKGVSEVAAALEEFSSRRGAQALLEVGYAANKLIEDAPPFKTIKTDPARAATTVNVACRLLEGLALLLSPFVPTAAAALWGQLGLPGTLTARRWADAAHPADPAGRRLGRLQHLFSKIEDATVEQEISALKQGAAQSQSAPSTPPAQPAAPAPAAPAAPAGEGPPASIDYATFAQLDLRVARVRSCEPVPKADKLLKLELELQGGEVRTVLSGIKQYYAPEALVGRQVVYLANLAPRKIRGVESQGMILAANGPQGEAILLQPEHEVQSGAKVS